MIASPIHTPHARNSSSAASISSTSPDATIQLSRRPIARASSVPRDRPSPVAGSSAQQIA